jgi:3-oxoacyl-[acyl-carrier protein] reductase
MSFPGKVALVTGGGRGVGAATAQLLAERGAQVVINYFSNTTAAEAIMQAIRAKGGEACAVQADVRDAIQVARLVETVLATYGRLDILVSNAAMRSPFAPFAQMPWEHFAQRVNDELSAAFHLTQAVLPQMTAQGSGHLIYVGSEHSQGPALPGSIAHGTAKAALVTFARYLAYELGPCGITANVVSPGRVETEGSAAVVSELFKTPLTASSPLGRNAQPIDVARVIAFFADDDSGFVTGTSLPVTGGAGIGRVNASPTAFTPLKQ